MFTICYPIHKTFKRWSLQLSKLLGIQIEPQILIIACSLVILFIQLTIYLALSSQTIYCHLPNLRFYYQSRTTNTLTNYERLPTIYVITPTYFRHVQKAELTRLSHTLMLVPNLHWIIVEDSNWSTQLVNNLIRRLKNEFDFHSITHLNAPTPERFKLKRGEPDWAHPKGVWQRNRAMLWIKENLNNLDRNGVIYFADDDNTYDLELFHEMRQTRRVSVWPVGLAGGLLVEKPIVVGGRIESFNSKWKRKRPFPLDMAGFAISLRLFTNNMDLKFSDEQQVGYVESNFLSQLVNSWDELEPLAKNCSKVLVWHTKTQNPALHEERKLITPSNSDIIE